MSIAAQFFGSVAGEGFFDIVAVWIRLQFELFMLANKCQVNSRKSI